MTNEEKRNIYNNIQNLYNMDFTTWQEVLAMLYNLVADVEQKFEAFEQKFELMLGKEVTEAIKKMHKDGTLAEIINEEVFADLNNKIDEVEATLLLTLTDYMGENNKKLEIISEQLEDIVQQTDGRKVKFIAFAIRNNGNGFQIIEDSLHAPLNALSVETNMWDITVNYKNAGTKVLSLIVAADETMAIEGINVGASVGLDKAVIKFSKQDDVFGYLTKSGGVINTWNINNKVSNNVDSIIWESDNNRLKIMHKKCFNSIPIISTRNPEIIAYPSAINTRGGFTTTYISFRENKSLSSIIRYNAGTWTTSDITGVTGMTWDSLNARLRIEHKKINNLCINLTSRVLGVQIIPHVVGEDYVILEFYKNGTKMTTENSDMNLIFSKQSDISKDITNVDDDTVVYFSYSGKYLIPTSDLTFNNSNFWCIGMIEV